MKTYGVLGFHSDFSGKSTSTMNGGYKIFLHQTCNIAIRYVLIWSPSNVNQYFSKHHWSIVIFETLHCVFDTGYDYENKITLNFHFKSHTARNSGSTYGLDQNVLIEVHSLISDNMPKCPKIFQVHLKAPRSTGSGITIESKSWTLGISPK